MTRPDCEVSLGDNVAYLGNPLPKRELTFNTSFTLFKYFRVAGVVDHRGGYKLYNATEQFRCVNFVTCQAAYDKSAPLARAGRAHGVDPRARMPATSRMPRS